MLYQLSYASRKLLTLANRKPNCKGLYETSKVLGSLLCPHLPFLSISMLGLPSTLWLDFLSGLIRRDHGPHVNLAARNPC